MQPEIQKMYADLGQSELLDRIGDYRIVTELARGGMGRVYLARRCGQAGFERLFAVKVMHQRLSGDPDATLMLLDEAHIASRVHHPNVVSVLDIGRHQHGYYLVMDYVEGCSLQQLLVRSPSRRPARLILPIMIEALRGLHAVHGLCNADGEPYKVVHRDVSPHNLLLGLDGACRVTDFGIAKAKERFTDTEAGVFKGKLGYVAPEQLGCGGKIDRRVDVWSAGVTLYVALTGELPFGGTSPVAIARNILNQPLRPPSQVGLKPPALLDAVVMRALARDPEERYPDAEAFADALRALAIEADLLGTPAEIAAWVDDACGPELVERRRVLSLHNRPDTGSFSRSRREPAMPLGSIQPPPMPVESARSVRHKRRSPRLPVLRAAGLTALALIVGGYLGLRERARTEIPTVTPSGEAALQGAELALEPTLVPAAAAHMPAPILHELPNVLPVRIPVEPAPSAPLAPRPLRARSAAPASVGNAESPPPIAAPGAQPDIMAPRVTRNPYLHGR